MLTPVGPDSGGQSAQHALGRAWVSGPGYLVPGKEVPFHPNELGMHAVTNLIADQLA
ncbi:MAG: hypothetical protein QM655_11395 [Nocardioidaceae bacterium]